MEKLKQDIRAQFGLTLSPRQVAAFQLYEQELMDWNMRFNLTAIREVESVRTKHFLDSLSCLLAFGGVAPKRLIDVGTGAGFPGIPLKIAYPAMQLTLVESVGKKAEFCRHMIEVLGMEKVSVVQARAEEVGHMPEHREKYDWAVARAVANLPVLSEYLLPLVRMGGAALFQKGENGPAEAHAAERAIRLLGGHLRQLKPVQLPGIEEDRYLIVVDKVAATPPAYPRRVGVPTKTPI